jgi:hypothetical protein
VPKVACGCVEYLGEARKDCPTCRGRGRYRIVPESDWSWDWWHQMMDRAPFGHGRSRLGHGVTLTDFEIDLVCTFKALPLPKARIIGVCTGCGRSIPSGYVPFVRHWRGENHNGFIRQVAEELYCQDCRGPMTEEARRRQSHRSRPVLEKEQKDMSAKEIAQAMLAVMSQDKGMSSKRIAEKAGLEYDPILKEILKRYRDAGKVRLEEGRWVLA